MQVEDQYSFITERKPTQLLPFYSILIFIAFTGLAAWIWYAGMNKDLFLLINAQHNLLSDQIWLAINFLTFPRMFIMPILLFLAALLFRREKLLNVILLIGLYFIVFAGLKHLVGEARPYVALPLDSFFWLNKYEDAIKSAHLSFPSGHTGSIAIFAFGMNYLFFAKNKPLQLIMLLLVILTGITRICTGWHWPLDVLASGLIGYILVKICFSINVLGKFRRKNYESY